jgi:serine/threonine protein kinase
VSEFVEGESLRDGLVKILDFGPAGTVNYLSPEQARGEPHDFRSDQFSLGAFFSRRPAEKPPSGGTLR